MDNRELLLLQISSQLNHMSQTLSKGRQSAFKKVLGIKLFKEPKYSKSNYWLQAIVLDKPSIKNQRLILKRTNSLGFGTRPVWNLLNKNRHLKLCPSMNLDTAKDLEKRIINLPSGAKL